MKSSFSNGDIDINMFIENMLHGYAYHKIILNKKNEAVDYIFLDINKKYEELTGLKENSIIGKKVTEVLPDIHEEDFNWINHYGDIALNDKKCKFEHWFSRLNKWFTISAFSPKKGYFVTLLSDITHRKITDQKLQQASDIVKNIQIGLHIYHLEDINDDRTLKMVDANPITEIYTGLPPEEVIGKTLDENFPGLREKNIPHKYAEVVRTQKPIELEDIYYGDNRMILSAFSVKAFPLPNNHMGVSFENITEKKASERKIIENQKFTARILNTSPNIIYVYDLIKQSNIFASQNIVESLGYTSKEIKDMGQEVFSILLHPDDTKLVIEHHQKLSIESTGAIHELTYRMKRKNGDWAWLLSRDAVFQRNEKSEVTQILGTAIDITQRKINEEKIKILEKFAEGSSQGLGIANLDNKIIYVNPALCKFIEEKLPENLLGNNFTNYIPERILKKLENQIIPRVIKKGNWSGESFIKTKSGKEIPTFENFFLLKDEKGNPQFIADIIIDITEKKKIEKELEDYRNNLEALVEERTEELKRSEQKFSRLYHNSPDMFMSVSTIDGKILVCNDTMLKKTGYNVDEIIGKSIFEIYHTSCTDKAKELFEKFKQTGKISNEELIVETKDGNMVDVELNASAEFDKKGNIIHSHSSWRDITLRKIAQKQLTINEQKFKALFYENNSVILLIDPDNGKIIDANQSACRYYGYSFEQITKMNIKQINTLSDEEIDIKLKNVKNHYRNHFLFKHELANGEIRDVEVYTGKIITENRSLLYSIVFDITERIKVEKALKQSEEKFRKLAELSPSGISIQTTKKFLYVNEAWVGITEFSETEALKLHTLESIHPDQKEKIKKRAKRRLKGEKEPNRYELKILTKSQKVKWIDLSITTIEYEGKLASLSVINDITKRKEAREALRESEKQLKLLNAQKDKFFSIISHDLKGPLGVFQKLLEVLYAKREKLKANEVAGYIELLYNSAKTTNNLLSNLLIWSRSQLNRIEMEPQKLKIKELAAETIELLEENAKLKTINIENKIDDHTFAFADKNSVLTVLRNLLTNAIHHTAKGGEISLEAKKLVSNFVEICVSDTGVGIQKETLGKLFKIDEDVSTKGTENEKGTGLGLILCKDFVEKNGGKIWVKSEVNKGSSFYFTLKATN